MKYASEAELAKTKVGKANLKRKAVAPKRLSAKPRHKFGAVATVNDGIRFDSKLEAKYYSILKLKQHEGSVLFFLRQVPLHIHGSEKAANIKYVCDFQVFYTDGRVEFIDIKGMETPDFKMKKKLVEANYPIEITVLKRGDF